MLDLTQIYLFAFGVLTIAGGIFGYAKAKSLASLIAGGISGALLVVAAYLVRAPSGEWTAKGLIAGFLVSVALAGRFAPSYLRTKKLIPAGLMAILAIGGALLTIVAFLERTR